MPNYVSVRIKPVRTSKACQQAEHDSRSRPPTYLKTSNVDSEIYLWGTNQHGRMRVDAETLKTKNKDNESRRANAREMMKKSAKEQADRFRENVGRSPQTNANWFITGVITFSPEGFPKEGTDKRYDFETRLWEHAKNYIEDLCKMLNANPVYMSLHRDETTPHFHFQLENSDKDNGKSISRKIKPKDCRKLQDLAGEEFADMGFVRGVSRDVTGAKHKSVRESHRIEQERLEKQTQEAREKKAEAEAEKRDIQDRIAQIRNKVLPELMEQESEILNLQWQKQDLTKELQDAKDKLAKTEEQNQKAQQEAESIEKRLEAANEEAESSGGLLKLYDKTQAQKKEIETLKEENEKFMRFIREKQLEEEFEEFENWAVDYQDVRQEEQEYEEGEDPFER